MNSAPSEATNSTMKIHNDQYPRRVALKFCQRRRLIGVSSNRPRRFLTTAPAGAADGTAVRASTSHLPRLEIDARIDPGVGEVGDQIDHEADQRKDVERRKHHGVVAVEHALEAEQPQAVEREDRLDQERAGEEGAHERSGKAVDD